MISCYFKSKEMLRYFLDKKEQINNTFKLMKTKKYINKLYELQVYLKKGLTNEATTRCILIHGNS